MAKKVVFLADCLVTQKAGIHFYTKQFIARTISQYPHNQYFIVLPYPYGELAIEEVIVPIKPWLPFHQRIRNFTSIPKAVINLKPDIVVEMAHFGPFRLPDSISQFTVIHDLTPILFPQWHDRLSTIMHKALLPKILKKATRIITNSVQTKRDVMDYLPQVKNKIMVAYPKIIAHQNLDSENDNSPKKHDKYLLAVGTIEPRKNYVLLIKAFNKLAKKYSDIQLRIVGYKGWKSQEFFDLIQRSSFKDRIFLEGYTSEERLDTLYRNAYAFVFPSLYEGFGMPLLEALGFGLPIVCSDLDTSREICESAAFYFPKNDEHELVKLLVQLLDDRSLVERHQQKSIERFELFNNQKLELDEAFG